MHFATGTVSLAKGSGAAILPVFGIQERTGSIHLIIEPAIHIHSELDRERGLEDAVSQYVALLESYVRRYPERYRGWEHLV